MRGKETDALSLGIFFYCILSKRSGIFFFFGADTVEKFFPFPDCCITSRDTAFRNFFFWREGMDGGA